MELKLIIQSGLIPSDTLLIVPYGIETPRRASVSRAREILLIVPYGIET